MLDQLKKDKLNKVASEFENFSLKIGTDLSIVPERVFKIGTDDKVVLGKLQDVLSVETEAVAITVDGELALHVEDLGGIR